MNSSGFVLAIYIFTPRFDTHFSVSNIQTLNHTHIHTYVNCSIERGEGESLFPEVADNFLPEVLALDSHVCFCCGVMSLYALEPANSLMSNTDH